MNQTGLVGETSLSSRGFSGLSVFTDPNEALCPELLLSLHFSCALWKLSLSSSISRQPYPQRHEALRINSALLLPHIPLSVKRISQIKT
ncbi:uncharacterized [Tachysurus ichikawai]